MMLRRMAPLVTVVACVTALAGHVVAVRAADQKQFGVLTTGQNRLLSRLKPRSPPRYRTFQDHVHIDPTEAHRADTRPQRPVR